MSELSLIIHDDSWREYFGGVECLQCEEKVPFRSKVYNEDETNNFICTKCYECGTLQS